MSSQHSPQKGSKAPNLGQSSGSDSSHELPGGKVPGSSKSDGTKKAPANYADVFSLTVTKCVQIDHKLLEAAQMDLKYTGFNAKEFALQHSHYIRDHAEKVAALAAIIVSRGTNRDKFTQKMSAGGKQIVEQVTTALGINWTKAQLNERTITPNRVLIAFPWFTVQALRQLKSPILRDFPWMFQHSAICSLIMSSDHVSKRTAALASIVLSLTVSKPKQVKECLQSAIDFSVIGFESDLVPAERKKEFHDKEIVAHKDDLKRHAKAFANLVATYNLAAPPVHFGNIDYDNQGDLTEELYELVSRCKA